MLLGTPGAGVEAEKISTICMTAAQWGQRKPVMGAVVDWAPGDGTGLG
jgi:hypothetical protein